MEEDWLQVSPAKKRCCGFDPRRFLIDLFEHPYSSKGAFVLCIFMILLILFSSISFIIETLPPLHNKNAIFWDTTEYVCIAIFTIEFILRLIGYFPHYGLFFKGFLNWVDLLSILPFYIELIVTRVVPSAVNIDFRALQRRVGPDQQHAEPDLPAHVPLHRVCLFATALYYLERGTWDPIQGLFIADDGTIRSAAPLAGPLSAEHGRSSVSDLSTAGSGWDARGTDGRSYFQSIPHAMWWAIATMTTVGYGDVYPKTPMGKLLAVFCMISGVLFVAIPTGVVANEFSVQTSKTRDEELKALEDAKAKRKAFRRAKRLEALQNGLPLLPEYEDEDGAEPADEKQWRRTGGGIELGSLDVPLDPSGAAAGPDPLEAVQCELAALQQDLEALARAHPRGAAAAPVPTATGVSTINPLAPAAASPPA
ncbi:putative potassium voltage-gated channel subfamily B member 2 [Paratrimastix pyriformis]|uniref:Potassium voltage-gated channel subfamily B member 2 n=1 Tax=Paratrimastix pyriformis TaxID=342808 RepID=A0ABQ8UW41_9EUKA|nr:putative potassium voltage-gated channel subfamily B member 2 [Paratrimastix pyriformis]